MSARRFDSTAIQAQAAKIHGRFVDIEGVMTDCRLCLMPDGEEINIFAAQGLG